MITVELKLFLKGALLCAKLISYYAPTRSELTRPKLTPGDK